MYRPLHLYQTEALDKSPDGIAALKHSPYDRWTGFMVALILLPSSVGIASALGTPPVFGIAATVVAGFLAAGGVRIVLRRLPADGC